MSDQNQGGDQGGKSGGRKRKRYIRNRRRGRKPQSEQPEVRVEEESASSRQKGPRKSSGKSKPRQSEPNLDPVKRARRDRRRRKRSGDRGGGSSAPVAEPVMELDIEPKRVFVYTHVLRPALRDAYEYRAEHFSHTGRTLADFRIDLSSILIYPDDDPEGEPTIDLHIGVAPGDAEPMEDSDWDDDEPLSEELL